MNTRLKKLTAEGLAKLREWEASDPKTRVTSKVMYTELGISDSLFSYHEKAARTKRLGPQ